MPARRPGLGNFSKPRTKVPAVESAKAEQSSGKSKPGKKASGRHQNYGALNTPEKRASFLVQLRISCGNLGEACAAFGIVRRSLDYWRKKDPKFQSDIMTIISSLAKVRKRSEDEMRRKVLEKWYDALLNKDVSNRDLEAFINSLSKGKAANDEPPSGPIPEEDKLHAI